MSVSQHLCQVALITLMANGSFVPCDYAKILSSTISVGASDDLTAGQSTFMVEMRRLLKL